MVCLIAFLIVWRPSDLDAGRRRGEDVAQADAWLQPAGEVARAWVPWLILSVWSSAGARRPARRIMNTPEGRLHRWRWNAASNITNPQFPVPGLHNMVERMPPVVIKTAKEAAVFGFNWLSARAQVFCFVGDHLRPGDGFQHPEHFQGVPANDVKVRFSLLTIAAMLAVGFMTRYAGLDATMGLAFARTGHFIRSSGPCWAGSAWR